MALFSIYWCYCRVFWRIFCYYAFYRNATNVLLMTKFQQKLWKFCTEHRFLHMLWSLLPSKCSIAQCRGTRLRWTENTIELLDANQEIVFHGKICGECYSILRKNAFHRGLKVDHSVENEATYSNP